MLFKKMLTSMCRKKVKDEENISDGLALARDSLHNIRRVSEDSLYGVHIDPEKAYRLAYLREQFSVNKLDALFDRYTDRINQAYFSLFLLLQALLSLSQFTLVLFVNAESNTLDIIILDLILYSFTGVTSLLVLYFNERYGKTRVEIYKIGFLAFLLFVFLTDLIIPIYYYFNFPVLNNLRPANITHVLIACYIFSSVTSNLVAFLMGIFITLSYLLTLGFITYDGHYNVWIRLGTDIIYLACLNGMGVYYRFANELVKRKSFLDHRACVESTLKLQFEKQQEEQLMKSIIPEHTVNEVREDILRKIKDIENLFKLPTQDPLEIPFVHEHNNVSILYADIVNYTSMTSQLPVTTLVATLNDLFSGFDDASEQLQVLRIKFLGDCYYCVSGLPPDPAPNHGEACVDLGLKMISIIRTVRAARNLSIDMRIGIHSGKILSGIIGSAKWQFDIWSKDVHLANIMESTGEAGKVHITSQTYEHLEKSYNTVLTDKGSTDEKLIPYNVTTYLISPEISQDEKTSCSTKQTNNKKKLSVIGESIPKDNLSDITEARESITFIDNTELLSNEIPDGSFILNELDKQQVTSNNRRGSCQTPNLRESITFIDNTELLSNEIPDGSFIVNELDTRRVTSYNRRGSFHTPNLIENRKSITFKDNLSNGHNEDSFISNELDVRPVSKSYERRDSLRSPATNIEAILNRRPSGHPALGKRISGRRNTPRRTAFMDNNINRYLERLDQTDENIKLAIENMPLTKYEQFVTVKEINPFLLSFKDYNMELQYNKLLDPLFRYYIIVYIVLFIAIILIQNITLPRWKFRVWAKYGIVLFMIFILIPLTWMHYLWNIYFASRRPPDQLKPNNSFLKILYSMSSYISKHSLLRTAIYLILCSLCITCIVEELIQCKRLTPLKSVMYSYRPLGEVLFDTKQSSSEQCTIPWHMSHTLSLTIIASFSFLGIQVWIKFAFASLVTIFFSFLVWEFNHEFYEDSETYNYMLKPQIAHLMNLIYLTISLHFIDRQTDYLNRLDFQWNHQLQSEQLHVNTMHKVTQMLLKNILPIHVAELYLDVNRTTDNELYNEEYNNVAVIFATVVDFPMDLMSELYILKFINRIIKDFDNLLLKERRKVIEKIKVNNLTYMAACGLNPGRRDSRTDGESAGEHVAVTLIKFAVDMIKAIKVFNKGVQQECKLRVGISHGEVMGGVVGSKKPLYDIWGDTVNLASRMDSTGIAGSIQITENTATILQNNSIKCEYRGETFVKGKGNIPTYIVVLDDNEDLQYTDTTTYM